MNEGTTLTIPELAERWQCERRLIRKLIDSGDILGFTLRPGAKRPVWRVTLGSVLRFESRQQREKAAQ